MFKSVQVSSTFCRFVQKIKKTIIVLPCCNASLRSVLSYNYEYFMLKQCLENIGEGLLHACISSLSIRAIGIAQLEGAAAMNNIK